MNNDSYTVRREQLEIYFDRTAMRTWEQLTSEAPVSKVRQSVRNGRQEMQSQLLSWMPGDMQGKRLLDAGCGTGSLAIEAATRGAQVTAIDISQSLIDVAKKRTPTHLRDSIRYSAGDMLNCDTNNFDYVVAMDSLIHYEPQDMISSIEALCSRANQTASSVLFTFAPRTPLLMLMKNVGRLFPRGDRSPAIEPIAEQHLKKLIGECSCSQTTKVNRTHLVDTRFYKSQALELIIG